MRKLIETANALVKADRVWVPKTGPFAICVG